MLVLSANFLLLFVFWEGGRPVQLPADRLLVPQAERGRGGEEGVPRQPHRRLRLPAGHLPDLDDLRHARLLDRCCSTPTSLSQIAGDASDADDRDLPAAAARGDGQERPVPAARLVARRDGRPDAGQRPDPRRDDGHRRRLPGRPLHAAVRAAPRRPSWSSPCIGATTALLAALIALTQTDLKRVLAYSTVSQLGYMFMALGAGAAGAGAGDRRRDRRHVPPVHARFFKALLFLAAGSVMHAMGDVIDMRRFSGLRQGAADHALDVPLRRRGAGRRAAAWRASGARTKSSPCCRTRRTTRSTATFFTAIFWIATITALLTAFYTFRAYFLTFWGPERFPDEAGHHPHDAPPVMAWPLRILAIGAVGVGLAVGRDALVRPLPRSIRPGFAAVEQHGFHIGLMVHQLAGRARRHRAGVVHVRRRTRRCRRRSSRRLQPAVRPVAHKFYLDEIFTAILVAPLRWLGAALRAGSTST